MRLAMGVGISLDPWQQQDLIDGMGESGDWKCPECVWRHCDPVACPDHPDVDLLNPWAAFEVVEIDPRQNGKSEIEVARELGGALIIEEQLQIYSAHLFDTAMEIFLRLETIVLNSDDLLREVKHRGTKMVGIKHSHGEEGIEFRNGCRIRFKARTGAGGRGFTSDRLALDEAMILPERFLGSTVPTLSAVANPQLWLYGSAPDEEEPTHDGIVLAKRRVRALAGGDKSMAYFERSADWEGDPAHVPAAVLDDRRQWARANAALGTRIAVETVSNERAAMGARQFAVERLGITKWPDPSEEVGRVISKALWGSLGEDDPNQKIVAELAYCVDVNPERSKGSVGVAGRRTDEMWQFALAAYGLKTDWIVDRCVALNGERPGPFAVLSRGHAANLIPDLEAKGLRVISVDGPEYGIACSDFLDACDHREVRYPDPQPEITEALAGARKSTAIENAGTWSRKASTSADISPLVAVTVALWGARSAESEYTNVIFASDSPAMAPGAGEDPDVGPAFYQIGAHGPLIITPAEYTSCFRCATGSECPIHGGAS